MDAVANIDVAADDVMDVVDAVANIDVAADAIADVPAGDGHVAVTADAIADVPAGDGHVAVADVALAEPVLPPTPTHPRTIFLKKMMYLNQRIDWIKARNSHIQTNLEKIMSCSLTDVASAVDSIRSASNDIGVFSMQMKEISGYVQNAVQNTFDENDMSSSLMYLQAVDMDQTFSADAAEDL